MNYKAVKYLISLHARLSKSFSAKNAVGTILLICLFVCYEASAQTAAKEDLKKLSSDDRISWVFAHYFFNYNHADYDSILHVAAAINDERLLDYLAVFSNAAKANDKPYIEQQQLFAAFEHIAEHSRFDDVKGTFYFLKGTNAFFKKDYANALPMLFLSRKLLDHAGYRSYIHFHFYYYGFFAMYYFFEDYQSAADYCLLAIEKSGSHPSADMKTYYDNLGECYVKLKKYGEAKTAFEQAIAEADKLNDVNYRALCIGNLGNLLRLQGNYKTALPDLYTEATTNEKAIPENAALSRMYIANALLHLDSVDKSRQYLAPPAFVLPTWLFPDYDLIRLETQALYFEKTGNYRVAGYYKDTLLALKDSLKTLFDFKKLTTLESALQAEKYLNDRNALEIKVSNEKFNRNLVITILVILFAGIFSWLSYRRKTEKLLESRKLDEANQQLEQYLKHIRDKNELIEKMSSELQGLAPADTSAETRKYISNLKNSIILTDDAWQEFKKLFESAFPGYLDELNVKYPGLTPAELRLLTLEKLQLPTSDMANMLGISADSVRKNRYRLRKKFPDSIPLRPSEEKPA